MLQISTFWQSLGHKVNSTANALVCIAKNLMIHGGSQNGTLDVRRLFLPLYALAQVHLRCIALSNRTNNKIPAAHAGKLRKRYLK
jgi:hypothetical protein